MRKPLALVLFAVFALTPLVSEARQPATSDPAQQLLWLPSYDWSLAVGGKISLDARFFVERGGRRMLIKSPDVSNIALVDRRRHNVTALDNAAVSVSDDGESATLAHDATQGKATSPYTVDVNQQPPLVTFYLGDTKLNVLPKQPLVGVTTPADILRHSPLFKKGMDTYTPPMMTDIQTIKNYGEAIEIEVFFGTWCPHCKVLIPQFMKAIEMAANPNIRVVYIGVPRRLSSYPPAKEKSVGSVPGFIFYQNGKETHRIVEERTQGTIEHTIAQALSSQ